MKQRITTLLGSGLLAAMCGAAAAGPLEDGQAADQRGDYATAMRLLRPLADQGHAEAKACLGTTYYHLGARYFSSIGVPQDFAKAAAWFRKAADLGDVDAQRDLAGLYVSGIDVPQDLGETFQLYREAAEQGDSSSLVSLEVMCGNGQSTARDNAQTAIWWRKFDERGDFIAQYHLGEIYERGQGVLEDYVQSHVWFNLAAAQSPVGGFSFLHLPYAAQRRDELAAKMTPAQIAEAQRMARGWKTDEVTSEGNPTCLVPAPIRRETSYYLEAMVSPD
jgi:uncharacterized protein